MNEAYTSYKEKVMILMCEMNVVAFHRGVYTKNKEYMKLKKTWNCYNNNLVFAVRMDQVT